MKLDLILKNGTVVTSERNLRVDVAVKDGKIVAIGDASIFPETKETLNLEGKYILPGIIDIHCHFRDPGLTHKEDFATGTYAAAMGGITTIFEMPNTIPPVATPEVFEEKLNIIKDKAYVDFCLWATVAGNEMSHIKTLADKGAIAFKIFLGQTTGNIASPEEGALLEIFEIIKETGLRAAIHAEDQGFVDYFTNKLKAEGREDYQAIEIARGNTAEALAIARLIVLAEKAGNKVHIVHMSTKEGVELVKTAQAKGIDVTAETCPHYLVLTSSDYDSIGKMIKIFPPVRTEDNVEALWEAIRSGIIEIIASDHAPHTKEEKMSPQNIWDVPAGMLAVETSVPIMLNKVNEGQITINDFVRISSLKPAQLFNIYPRKGEIQVGSDGDFTIVDMEKEVEIKASNLHTKNKFTPYEGYKVKGYPIYTILRGNIIMAEGQLVKGPLGAFINPNDL